MPSSSRCRRPDTVERILRPVSSGRTVLLKMAGRAIFIALALSVGMPASTHSFSPGLYAQPEQGSIHGVVVDPSGALVAHAHVSVSNSKKTSVAVTGPQGNVLISPLDAGVYSLTVTAAGFAVWHRDRIRVKGGMTTEVDVHLNIEMQKEQIFVDDRGPTIGLEADQNASALRLYGADLDALPDDPTDLQSELMAMAGPSSGSGAGEIYVDGFSGAILPAKSAIQVVSINQDPFSARHDRPGFGRIEVVTKAGTDRIHGDFSVGGNDSAFNSRNPFAPQEPPYHSIVLNGDLSGPVTRNSSYFLNVQRGEMGSVAVVNAIVLDTNFNETPFSETISNPSQSIGGSGRFDTQLGSRNTLGLRYQMNRNQVSNSGVGQFALPSQGYHADANSTVIEASDNEIFSPHFLEQSQIQYVHQRTNQDVISMAPGIVVQGAFTGGGNAGGSGQHVQDQYEVQETISLDKGNHSMQFGGRFRAWQLATRSEPDFNGQFLFSSISAYQATQIGLQQGLSPVQIRALGGGASQFNLGAGEPKVGIAMMDFSLYWQDDWRLRPSLTGSYGFRFESQDDIHDRADPAPRLAIAWAPTLRKGRNPRTVIRTGYGWFYTRFGANSILQSTEQDGVHQQQYTVANPDFYPTVPAAATLGAQTPPTLYRVSANLRSSLLMQAQISVDRQLGRSSTVSVSYSNSRGVHQFLSRNINASLPGTYNPADPTSGVRPLGNDVSIYQYESGGVFRQNQLTLNLRIQAGRNLSLFGYYSLNGAEADTTGPGSFPSNQYNLAADWGRADYDIRHRFYLGGSIRLPGGFQLSPRITASSGVPFNVVLGEDLNGDGQFNDRPAFATDLSRSSVIRTALGNFDTDPIPGQKIIPVNLGTGPPQFVTNLRFAKTLSFGRESASASSQVPIASAKRATTKRRYSLSLDAYVRNLFNNVNLAPPIGTVGSPLFGRSNALSGGQGANRTINMNISFRF